MNDEDDIQELSGSEIHIENVEPEIENSTDIEIEEDTSKKPDNELINEYLKPNPRCICCSTPVWSVKLNKSYLDGATYSEMIERFSSKFEERTGRSLNKSLLTRHFNGHFDARAAAISQYNKSRNSSSANISGTQKQLFKLATDKVIDEFSLFDATIKEMISKYEELQIIIDARKAENKTFGMEDTITLQTQILANLAKQAISKFKAVSKVDLESKQGQVLSSLGFLNSRMSQGLLPGMQNNPMLPPPNVKETEKLYLGVVIHQITGRALEALNNSFRSSSDDQKLFLRELKKNMMGIQEAIQIEFEKKMNDESEQRQRALENKNKDDLL